MTLQIRDAPFINGDERGEFIAVFADGENGIRFPVRVWRRYVLDEWGISWRDDDVVAEFDRRREALLARAQAAYAAGASSLDLT